MKAFLTLAFKNKGLPAALEPKLAKALIDSGTRLKSLGSAKAKLSGATFGVILKERIYVSRLHCSRKLT